MAKLTSVRALAATVAAGACLIAAGPASALQDSRHISPNGNYQCIMRLESGTWVWFDDGATYTTPDGTKIKCVNGNWTNVTPTHSTFTSTYTSSTWTTK